MHGVRLSRLIVTTVMSEVRQMAAGLPLPSQKFLASMLLGLLMAQSSLLSDIARRLKALTSITFHALHKRLCWSLKATRWSVMPVQERYLQQAASKLGRDRLIAVDLGD